MTSIVPTLPDTENKAGPPSLVTIVSVRGSVVCMRFDKTAASHLLGSARW